jgi:hypothetical protein
MLQGALTLLLIARSSKELDARIRTNWVQEPPKGF